MKKLLIIAALALFGGQSYAQMQASAGLELGIPFKDYTNFMAGVSGGFEYVVVGNLALTGQLGFQMIFTDKDIFKNELDGGLEYSNIPVIFFQVGAKYYFQEVQKGFYGHGQLGIHNRVVKYTYDGQSSNEPNYSYTRAGFSGAIGIGYQLEKLDFGLRFNGVTGSTTRYYSGYTGNYGTGGNSDGFSYVGLRIAYLIPVGD